MSGNYRFRHPLTLVHVFKAEKLTHTYGKPTPRSVMWVAFENWMNDWCEHGISKSVAFKGFARLLGDPVTGPDGKPAYRWEIREARKRLDEESIAAYMDEDEGYLADDAARLVEQLQTVEDPITGQPISRAALVADMRAAIAKVNALVDMIDLL